MEIRIPSFVLEISEGDKEQPETTMNAEAPMKASATCNFSEALYMMRFQGERMQRLGWNGSGMYVAVQRPSTDSMMTLPYLYLYTAQHDFVPWLVSQTDLLSDDWCVF